MFHEWMLVFLCWETFSRSRETARTDIQGGNVIRFLSSLWRGLYNFVNRASWNEAGRTRKHGECARFSAPTLVSKICTRSQTAILHAFSSYKCDRHFTCSIFVVTLHLWYWPVQWRSGGWSSSDRYIATAAAGKILCFGLLVIFLRPQPSVYSKYSRNGFFSLDRFSDPETHARSLTSSLLKTFNCFKFF